MLKSNHIEDAPTTRTNILDQTENIVVVDAMFGTGVILPLSNFHYDVINMLMNILAFTFSVDIPSGVEGDTGFIQGNAIIADITFAVGLPKMGYYIADGAKTVGQVEVLDAGFPWDVMQNGNKYFIIC